MSPSAPLQQSVRNKVLAALPGDEMQRIRNSLTPVRMVSDQVLIEYRHETEHVFFVEEGIVSMIAGASWSHPTFQVAMIGSEGIVGCETMLGTRTGSFTRAAVQTPGLAYRMMVHELERVLPLCPTFRALCMSAVEALMHQSMQTSVFSARNKLAERCIRWLLMVHDRNQGDELMVTHESMSGLLGVRRSGVTAVASMLQDVGFVRVGRGRITILNRAGLEEMLSGASWSVETTSGRPQDWRNTVTARGSPGSGETRLIPST